MKSNYLVWVDILKTALFAVLLAFVIRIFIFQPFYIPSPSMQPTLKPGDRIIASKIPYFFNPIKVGDIVVFKFPLDTSKDYIKRVVALENDIVQIKNNSLYVNNKKIAEEYLPQNIEVSPFGPVKVPAGSVFVMGDNREDSYDSRYWGPLNKKFIVSKAIFRFWPISRIGLLRQ
ncbi:MAG: signal peptidase [Clostridia bacterium]|jgi:signal peptidase I|nr:signal peptidase [Clostridiales bacterium]MDK2984728.1 signal peptidase [Clostridia bacterium]